MGLRQGCVMSPWLFNIYMDGVMREVNGKGGRAERKYTEKKIIEKRKHSEKGTYK